jgi:hypothetical protein
MSLLTTVNNSSEIAFDIGWDFARFGRPMDPVVTDTAILSGFCAGREHFRVPQHVADRFVSKWLQLRINAFRRRRILSPDVTPDYLKRIDYPTCPVTLARLTHSTLTDSDWSIDRINNDGAYAAGNLMVVSTKVNRAKGAKSYEEVADLTAIPTHVVADGLTARQWARLRCLMVGADGSRDVARALGPLLTRIPEDCRVPLYFVVQQILLRAVARAPVRNQFVKSLNRLHPEKDQHVALGLAAERLALLIKGVPYEYDALADENVQRFLRRWFTSLPAAATGGLVRFCAEYGGSCQEQQALPEEWSLQTQGRF